jgi:hypothetical protein
MDHGSWLLCEKHNSPILAVIFLPARFYVGCFFIHVVPVSGDLERFTFRGHGQVTQVSLYLICPNADPAFLPLRPSGSAVFTTSIKGLAREKLMVSCRSVGPPERPLKIFFGRKFERLPRTSRSVQNHLLASFWLRAAPVESIVPKRKWLTGGSAELGRQTKHLNQKSGVFGNELSTVSYKL